MNIPSPNYPQAVATLSMKVIVFSLLGLCTWVVGIIAYHWGLAACAWVILSNHSLSAMIGY